MAALARFAVTLVLVDASAGCQFHGDGIQPQDGARADSATGDASATPDAHKPAVDAMDGPPVESAWARLLFAETKAGAIHAQSRRFEGNRVVVEDSQITDYAASTATWVRYAASPTGAEVLMVEGTILTITGWLLFTRAERGTWQQAPASFASSQATVADTRNFDIAFDGDGDAVLVYVDEEDNLVYRTVTPPETAYSQKTLVALGDGVGTAEWVELVPDPTTGDIVLGMSDDQQQLVTARWDGDGWGSPAILEDDNGDRVSKTGGRPFAISVASDGSVWAAWGIDGAAKLYYAIDGTVQTAMDTAATIETVDLAALGGGNVAGCAYDSDGAGTLVAVVWPAQGTPSAKEFVVVSGDTAQVAAVPLGEDALCVFPDDESADPMDPTFDWVSYDAATGWGAVAHTPGIGGPGDTAFITAVGIGNGEALAVLSEGKSLFAAHYSDDQWTAMGPKAGLSSALAATDSQVFGIAPIPPRP
ncbi:MAG TPA: hypothetical protein VFG83_02265 [Kofleriaceae bacterium]|nr:hypothetical protein [Kofleriaceae bacterium]